MPEYATSEHRGANEFLSREHPRGRRGSISQSNNIHLAGTLEPTEAHRDFSSAEMEALRRARTGAISIRELVSMLHPAQEVNWRPQLGGGRRQIRTGRNFIVPDREHPGQNFVVRIHTNDNTIDDRTLNSHHSAVVRIQREHDGRYLMGGRTHVNTNGAAAWSGRGANDAEINAAHIPTVA